MTASFDVAIVGCGPIGAYAANLCGKYGFRTVVLEREGAPYPLPRAVHLDHEMMRLFADVGLLDAIAPLMFATDGHIHIGADGGVIRYLGSAGSPRPYHFANDYFFYQPELEQVLRQSLERFEHVSLRLGADVEDITQSAEGAVLTLAGGERLSARIVIGCDGARSAVRRALGVRLDDLDFEEPWLVVDAEVDGPISFPGFGGVPQGADLQRLSVMLCDPRRPATIVPGRGNHRRWEFMLLPGEDDAEMMAPDVVTSLVAPWVRDVPHRIVRAATYRFHGLVAERWSEGLVFLAGDAAHQTPPFFGQGMCHGLRDAANLLWKLDLVVRGEADAALLDSYQRERDPHVRAVIGAALDAGRYICELDPDLAIARDARLRDQTGPRTAADLIPALKTGVVQPGAGDRFIQPMLVAAHGRTLRLDELSGGGWVLVQSSAASLTAAAAALWERIGGSTITLGIDATDPEGHLRAWFEKYQAIAAVVRPDFYTYAAPADATGLSQAIEQLGALLHLKPA